MSEKKYDVDLVSKETMREYCRQRLDYESGDYSWKDIKRSVDVLIKEATVKPKTASEILEIAEARALVNLNSSDSNDRRNLLIAIREALELMK